jgi:Flp pilus assembly protein TadB
MKGRSNGSSDASHVYDEMKSSIDKLKKTVSEIQKRPYEVDNRLAKMEERLELSINEKYSRQKNIMLVALIILIVTVFLSVVNFYFR